MDEAVREATAEHGGAARQLYELLTDQWPILTAHRLDASWASRRER